MNCIPHHPIGNCVVFVSQDISDCSNTSPVNLRPDRLVTFSYAHVPWIKGSGQRGFNEEHLPKEAAIAAAVERGRNACDERPEHQADTNLQDNVTMHCDTGVPARVGARVSVGHGAILHGCTVEDDCLIGMGSTVLNGAVIGTGSLVAAGAVVLEGTVVPPGSLVAGVPAKVRRELTDDERAGIRHNADHYLSVSAAHALL